MGYTQVKYVDNHNTDDANGAVTKDIMAIFYLTGIPVLWRELLRQSTRLQREDNERDAAQVTNNSKRAHLSPI